MRFRQYHVFMAGGTACGRAHHIAGWPDDEAVVHPDGWHDIPKSARCAVCDELYPALANGVHMWVVFDRPVDFPDHYVVRKQIAYSGRVVPTEVPWSLGATLDDVRATLPAGLARLERDERDVTPLVEVWFEVWL